MKAGAVRSFAALLKAFRKAAGDTQEELATIAGLPVQSVSWNEGNVGGRTWRKGARCPRFSN